MKQQRLAIIILSIILGSFSPVSPWTKAAFAEDISVSGNGAESANNVSVAQSSNTTVSQSNESATQNTVQTDAQTGDNSASHNNGDVAVTTGDVNSQVAVNTTANSSVAETGCCQAGGQITLSGNGAGSNNGAIVTNTTTITTTTNQKATITNTIQGSAVTGKNTANGNTGDVVIHSGDVTVKETIKNGPLNTVSVKSGVPSGVYNVQIKGNGAGSENSVQIAENVLVEHNIIHEAFITNNSFWDLITGNNSANKNNGDVVITTGDIKLDVKIENGPINTSIVEDNCCKVKPPQAPPPTPTPKGPAKEDGKPGNGGGGNGGNGGGGVGGPGAAAAGGQILPVTGVNWMLFALLANVVMLFMGMVLRLRSGRSPGFFFNLVR